jgi:2-polyprenyl-6-methoxyphenol hydroxylase-like FAD-dependent oxidoreductase
MSRAVDEFAVLGGGIGGLAAALALARSGKRVRVLERAPEFGEVGAGLQVGPNASRVLDRLGVLDAITATAFFPRRLILRDALSGESITALDTGDAFVKRFGYRYFVAHRADLHQALLSACRDSGLVELMPAKHAVEVWPEPAAAAVRCDDGSVYAAAAVIGADGLHSLARQTVLNDGPPLDSGYVAYRGTVPIDQVRSDGGLAEPDSMVIWVGPGLHLVQYPVRRGELCNQVATFDTRRYPAGSGDISAELDHAFAGTYPAVARGAALIDRSRRWPMLDRPPVTGWSAGHVTLVGDAAHPMLQYLAQGACQAIEDSVVLADSVARHRDIGQAFIAFEELRAPRTARVQVTARNWGDTLHIDGVGAVMRRRLLAQRSHDDLSEAEWLYGYDATTALDSLEPA